MGVYIPKMKVPETCGKCLDVGWHYVFDCHIDECDTRMQSCPLVEVKPHGRLIDADALRQSIKESIDECHKWAEEVEGGEMYARVSQALGTFVECSLRVKAAPTIIEAEPTQSNASNALNALEIDKDINVLNKAEVEDG